MNYHRIEDDPRYKQAEAILNTGFRYATLGFTSLFATTIIALFAPYKWFALGSFTIACIAMWIANVCRDDALEILNTIPKRGDDDGSGSEGTETK